MSPSKTTCFLSLVLIAFIGMGTATPSYAAPKGPKKSQANGERERADKKTHHRLENNRGTVSIRSSGKLSARNTLIKHENINLRNHGLTGLGLSLLGGATLLMSKGSIDVVGLTSNLAAGLGAAGVWGAATGATRILWSHALSGAKYTQQEYGRVVDHINKTGREYLANGVLITFSAFIAHKGVFSFLYSEDSLHGSLFPAPSLTDPNTIALTLFGAGASAAAVAYDSRNKRQRLLEQEE